MRKRIVAGNWKMNKTLEEACGLACEINAAPLANDVSVILAPPYPFLVPVAGLVKENARISLAAQNCAWEEKGAYTGEISAAMIRSCNTDHVIIGHSERRMYFKEDSVLLKKKIITALTNGLKIIYCVGESLEERQSGRAFEVVKAQLEEVLAGLDTTQFQNVIVAYEPVWAIGTGHTATAEQAQEMHEFIRSSLASMFGNAAADSTSILYGGSCNPGNAAELFSCKDVDGGLIGGASLEAASFTAIVNAFQS